MCKLDDIKKEKGLKDEDFRNVDAPNEHDVYEDEIPEIDEDEIPEIDEDDDIPDGIEEKESTNKKLHVEEIETRILSIILNNQEVPEQINEHSFTNQTNKEIFRTIEYFSSQDEKARFDSEAVALLLTKRRNNDKWKNTIIPEIIDITKNKDVKLENYLNMLKIEHTTIKATKIAEELKKHLNNGNLDYLKVASSELGGIDLFEDKDYDSLKEALDFAVYDLHEAIDSDDSFSGIPTGVPTLDDTTGGLQRSDFIVLAARPGQGKTATAINFAYNSGVPCGFISSEMPSRQLGLRLLSLDSGVNAQKLRHPKKLLKNEISAILDSQKRLETDHQIYINDKPAISIQEVKELAKEWKQKFDIQVLFIDYIQRLTYKAPGSEKMPRHERIGMIAMEAKEIARELNIAVVGLAQISRGAEKNEATGGRPMLSDLKDSGMIEQEADLVICPYRSNTDGMNVNAETEMEILILKNRHGPLGEIPVIWIPRNMKIIENEDGHVDYDSGDSDENEDEDDIPY